jgi:hypothetical protein
MKTSPEMPCVASVCHAVGTKVFMLTTLAAPRLVSSVSHYLSLEIKLRVETAMHMYETNNGVVELCTLKNCRMDSDEQTQRMGFYVLRVS